MTQKPLSTDVLSALPDADINVLAAPAVQHVACLSQDHDESSSPSSYDVIQARIPYAESVQASLNYSDA